MFSCLSPITIKQSFGRSVTVGCGQCAACHNLKGSKLFQLLEEESRRHKYTEFITLTYRDADIPLASFTDMLGDNKRYVFCETDRLKKYYQSDVISVEPINDYVNFDYDFYATRFKLPDEYIRQQFIPYADLHDVQNFLKRYRKRITLHIDKYEAEPTKIRYYYVSEYGPQSFRPHFHLLVFHDSEKLRKLSGTFVSESWKFGRIDAQLATGKATSYVSKYVLGSSNVSKLHNMSCFKPRQRHSRYFGETVVPQDIQEKPYDKGFKQITRQVFRATDGLFVAPPSSYIARHYPKCPRYSLFDARQLFRAYTFYIRAFKRFRGFDRPRLNLTKLVRLIALYDTPIRKDLYELYGKISHESIFGILLSGRTFYNNCVKYSVNPRDMVRYIYNFYKDKDYELLKSQYEQQQKFVDQYGVGRIRFLVNMYDNFHASHTLHTNRRLSDIEHNLRDYYFLTGLGFSPFMEHSIECLDKKYNPAYTDFEKLSYKISRDNVKHKRLNDLNKMFLYG